MEGSTYKAYYYTIRTNVQGDVLGVYNQSGVCLVSYTYDAWGNFTTSAPTSSITNEEYMARELPFRYRGYYYDAETYFYYLNTRYYDPYTCRFLNADSVIPGVGGTINGYNLFSYCFNNPVNLNDASGNWPEWLSGMTNVIGGLVQIVGGIALGASIGWTGVGLIPTGVLILNGISLTTQGIGQIVNDIANEKILRDDNITRSTIKRIGEDAWGEKGSQIMGSLYDMLVVASGMYALGIASKNALALEMPEIVNSKIFSHNNGYGYKIGKFLEILYRNPNAKGGMGGTIFSYNGVLGKLRFDWDPAHGFHFHPPGH